MFEEFLNDSHFEKEERARYVGEANGEMTDLSNLECIGVLEKEVFIDQIKNKNQQKRDYQRVIFETEDGKKVVTDYYGSKHKFYKGLVYNLRAKIIAHDYISLTDGKSEAVRASDSKYCTVIKNLSIVGEMAKGHHTLYKNVYCVKLTMSQMAYNSNEAYHEYEFKSIEDSSAVPVAIIARMYNPQFKLQNGRKYTISGVVHSIDIVHDFHDRQEIRMNDLTIYGDGEGNDN